MLHYNKLIPTYISLITICSFVSCQPNNSRTSIEEGLSEISHFGIPEIYENIRMEDYENAVKTKLIAKIILNSDGTSQIVEFFEEVNRKDITYGKWESYDSTDRNKISIAYSSRTPPFADQQGPQVLAIVSLDGLETANHNFYKRITSN